MRLIRATGDPRQEAFRGPSPLKAARPFLVLSLVPLVAGVAGLIPQLDGFVLGALIAGAGALRAAIEYRQLSRLRRLADRQLLGTAAPRVAELVAWRTGELTSERNRRVLAKTLRGVVSELDARRLPGASPLNRTGARHQAGLICALADRVGDAERPVSAQGVLLVEELLTDGWGPLYARDRVDELGASLRRCLTSLDRPESPAVAGSRSPMSEAHPRLHVTRNGRH
jgi:hypothetical protein